MMIALPGFSPNTSLQPSFKKKVDPSLEGRSERASIEGSASLRFTPLASNKFLSNKLFGRWKP